MIRQAIESDAPWVTRIWNQVIRDTTFTFTTELKSENAVRQMIEDAGDAFLVWPNVGFAMYHLFRAGPGYAHVREHTIYLDPAEHGRGTGRKLLEKLEDIGRSNGVEIFVAGMSSSNDVACAFHKRLGYIDVARMPGVGKKWGQDLDLVLMQKNLRDTRDARV